MINALLVILFFATNAFIEADKPESDSATVGLIGSVIGIIVLPLGTMIWLYFSKSEFRMPAWDRSPFGSADPLQSLFICTWCTLAVFVALLVRILHWGQGYFWTAIVSGSVFIGLFVTRLLAHRVFGSRIESSRDFLEAVSSGSGGSPSRHGD